MGEVAKIKKKSNEGASSYKKQRRVISVIVT